MLTHTTENLRRFVNSTSINEQVEYYKSLNYNATTRRKLLELTLSMIDLTTLEGTDTPAYVRNLCHRAHWAFRREDGSYAKTASVCLYPSMIPVAVDYLSKLAEKEGTPRQVKIAAVATYFPSGLLSEQGRQYDVTEALDAGADEIDMVINRGAFLSGDYDKISEDIRRVKNLCGEKHLKVILETGELKTLENIRHASTLAIDAGADFIKTSTGKISPGATLPATLVMLQAIRTHFRETGVRIGMKPAGGIRTAKDAIAYLSMLYGVLGPDWLTPELFRFGASSLLKDVCNELKKIQPAR